MGYSAMAQQILVVEPGQGTLNAAITANGGNKIYQLKAGEWYGLDAPIENADYHLQIIGQEPAVAGGMPATLQTGSDVNAAAFDKMFDAKGDITLRNIYFVNADLNAQVANQFLVQSKFGGRITIDRCVLQPSGVAIGINGQGGMEKCYFTNNQVIGFGHQTSPNDGHFFSFGAKTKLGGVDTLFVENNTFVCMGMNVFSGSFGDAVHNLVNFNHNTFCMTKSQIDWATKKKSEFWTSNLMFDVQTQPYVTNWQPMPGGDPTLPKPNLIYADNGDTLPHTRPCFVQYNSHYRAKGFYDLIKELNDWRVANNQSTRAYLYPLTWPKDTVTCREAHMFNSTEWPNFKYGNTITDVDPKWNDTRIYTNEAKFIQWTRPASYIHAFGEPAGNYPPASEWPQWWWIPSGDLSNNSVWPVFDGTYTDYTTLHGSIEKNVPLGDLNWYPSAKAAVAAHKAEIMAHIKAGNTGQIDIGILQTGVDKTKTKTIGIYPNPAYDILIIEGANNASITISNMNGKIVKSVRNVSRINISDLSAGLYSVTVKEGNNVTTQKVVIAK